MRVAWKYIDKGAATVAALRDYDCMRSIIANTPDEVKELHHQMVLPKVPNLSGMPHANDPLAGENKLIAQLDRLDALLERYASATNYMEWFEPAWLALDDTNRHVLREFYMGSSMKTGATQRLAESYEKSESHVERMRSKAVGQLQTLLFG